jgi:hypothetical protein
MQCYQCISIVIYTDKNDIKDILFLVAIYHIISLTNFMELSPS